MTGSFSCLVLILLTFHNSFSSRIQVQICNAIGHRESAYHACNSRRFSVYTCSHLQRPCFHETMLFFSSLKWDSHDNPLVNYFSVLIRREYSCVSYTLDRKLHPQTCGTKVDILLHKCAQIICSRCQINLTFWWMRNLGARKPFDRSLLIVCCIWVSINYFIPLHSWSDFFNSPARSKWGMVGCFFLVCSFILSSRPVSYRQPIVE